MCAGLKNWCVWMLFLGSRAVLEFPLICPWDGVQQEDWVISFGSSQAVYKKKKNFEIKKIKKFGLNLYIWYNKSHTKKNIDSNDYIRYIDII